MFDWTAKATPVGFRPSCSLRAAYQAILCFVAATLSTGVTYRRATGSFGKTQILPENVPGGAQIPALGIPTGRAGEDADFQRKFGRLRPATAAQLAGCEKPARLNHPDSLEQSLILKLPPRGRTLPGAVVRPINLPNSFEENPSFISTLYHRGMYLQ